MGRNLVICCDGTNNQFGSQNTNVVRLVQVLHRDPFKQRLYYDPGVGTLPEPGALGKIGKKLSELKGLAFGAGLSRNVEEAYSYLMDVWEPGDQVFLFGFSRGAYTVRVLAALLHSLGLLPRGAYNLVPYVMRLFRAVRKQKEADNGVYWKLCNQFRWTFARSLHEGDDSRRFRVHFLGVWDTVSSVGWVWNPTSYPYTFRNPSIDVVRHAVSIDERRWFFRQNLMRPTAGQDFRELWFPGVHCDVGGGYPEKNGRLWRISLEWMLRDAHTAGLLLDEKRVARVLPELIDGDRLWDEPLNNSLTPAWWPAEFFPKLQWRSSTSRRLPAVGLFRFRNIHDGALIHQSALLRLRDKGDYAPRNLRPFLGEIQGLERMPESLPFRRMV